MKKIALLLFATVFIFGIQSCSTEEFTLEEEVLLLEDDTEVLVEKKASTQNVLNNTKNQNNSNRIYSSDDLALVENQEISLELHHIDLVITYPAGMDFLTRHTIKAEVKQKLFPSLKVSAFEINKEVWQIHKFEPLLRRLDRPRIDGVNALLSTDFTQESENENTQVEDREEQEDEDFDNYNREITCTAAGYTFHLYYGTALQGIEM